MNTLYATFIHVFEKKSSFQHSWMKAEQNQPIKMQKTAGSSNPLCLYFSSLKIPSLPCVLSLLICISSSFTVYNVLKLFLLKFCWVQSNSFEIFSCLSMISFIQKCFWVFSYACVSLYSDSVFTFVAFEGASKILSATLIKRSDIFFFYFTWVT